MFMSLLSIFGPLILKMILGAFEKKQIDAKTMKAVLNFIKEFEERDYEDQINLDESLEKLDQEVIDWIAARRAAKGKK